MKIFKNFLEILLILFFKNFNWSFQNNETFKSITLL